MLITFSKDLSHEFRTVSGDWRYSAVTMMARLCKSRADVKWARFDESSQVHRIRFTLPDASTAQHDVFIDAMFKLDPFARIKTAKADYDGADDWLAQKAARVG